MSKLPRRRGKELTQPIAGSMCGIITVTLSSRLNFETLLDVPKREAPVYLAPIRSISQPHLSGRSQSSRSVGGPLPYRIAQGSGALMRQPRNLPSSEPAVRAVVSGKFRRPARPFPPPMTAINR